MLLKMSICAALVRRHWVSAAYGYGCVARRFVPVAASGRSSVESERQCQVGRPIETRRRDLQIAFSISVNGLSRSDDAGADAGAGLASDQAMQPMREANLNTRSKLPGWLIRGVAPCAQQFDRELKHSGRCTKSACRRQRRVAVASFQVILHNW